MIPRWQDIFAKKSRAGYSVEDCPLFLLRLVGYSYLGKIFELGVWQGSPESGGGDGGQKGTMGARSQQLDDAK